MNRPQKDYIREAFCMSALIVLLLIGISFIPPFVVGDIKLRRANILSDLVDFPSDTLADKKDENSFLLEADSLLHRLEQIDSVNVADNQSVERTPLWEMSNSIGTATNSVTDLSKPLFDASTMADEIGQLRGEDVQIEQFDSMSMVSFCRALSRQRAERPLRIAVLGDSFIENDILTADLRENFQEIMGGNGVGFIPLASPIAQYRATTLQNFDGWESHSLMNYKKVPEDLRNRFFVSGLLAVPSEGATAEIAGSDFRNYLEEATAVRLLFVNQKSTEIRVIINDSLHRSFTPPSSNAVQQIIIRGNISNLKMSLHQIDGFVGYGVVFEDRSGVCVDNYSVRGNSGQALFNTNVDVNRQINRLLQYDLVILQYGLNVMQSDVVDYSTFGRMLERLVKYVRGCFNDCSVLIMGVGDRAFNVGDSVCTTPAVRAMIDEQRRVAKSVGAAFWNTFEVMGGENSMREFVARRWAAADNVHIGYAGGRYIARSLFRSLMDLHNDQNDIEEDVVGGAVLKPQILLSDTLLLDSLPKQIVERDSVEVDMMLKQDSLLPAVVSDSVVTKSLDVDSLPSMELDTSTREEVTP